MGGEQAATVLTLVEEEKRARAGRPWPAAERAAAAAATRARYEAEGAARYATARLWDDGGGCGVAADARIPER
jgi:hypothetical protein